jgi:hypothetical protein
MIRVDRNEQFPITVALLDENTGANVSDQTVYYDVRYVNDTPLAPPVSGTLIESAVEDGIYRTTESISESGTYIIYATCSGFNNNVEALIVNEENIYDLTKQNRNYNISVEDVTRTNIVATASQLTRNVTLNNTDYLLTIIKNDVDNDWGSTTVSGLVYAWYKTIYDEIPYRMGPSD